MAIEVDNWNTTNPDAITNVSGTNVAEGMAANLVNNAIRRVMSAVGVFRDKAYCRDQGVTIAASGGALPSSPVEGDMFLEY